MEDATIFNYDILDESHFPEIADRLLNECYLSVNGKKYRFAEIEFYLKSDHHPDIYTHCDADQLKMHTFYFHKFRNGTYKSGTFKGMDLTFGNDVHPAHFGILIRALYDIKEKKMIEGPCNVVNRILADYKILSIDLFTKGKNLNIFQNEHNFVVQINEDLEKYPIWAGPRIGLSDKYPEYHKRLYRFIIMKDLIKKQKTSLVQITD